MTAAPLLRVEPAFVHAPLWVVTVGDEVGGLCADAGFAPDEDQQFALDGIFGKDESGKPSAFETWLIACRQNIKTATMKMATVGWAFIEKVDPIMWTAHEYDPAISEAVSDLDDLISGYRWLARQVRYFHKGERQEEIGLKSGVRIMFKTRMKGTGRGLAGEKTILDEGWALQAAHLGALIPTMSARSMSGSPQILGGSSAARPESGPLRAVVKRGRDACADEAVAAAERRLFYVEYCAPDPEVACARGAKCDHALTAPGCGCDNPEMIRLANPAIGRRISLDYVLTAERRSMPPAEFGRERMGWHDEGEDEAEVIPLVAWAAQQDEDSEPSSSYPFCLSVVFSSDRGRAAAGLAGWRDDGLVHVEVANYQQGTGWVVPWVADRWEKHDPIGVVVDPHGHEGSVITELEDAGVKVIKPNASDVAAAYGMFFDAVTDSRSLRHRGQDDLTLALAGATTRPIGDAGTAWGRRKSGVDISPLDAVTKALWGFLTNAPPMDTDEPGVWVF